jgi:hypothetical protein
MSRTDSRERIAGGRRSRPSSPARLRSALSSLKKSAD